MMPVVIIIIILGKRGEEGGGGVGNWEGRGTKSRRQAVRQQTADTGFLSVAPDG